MQHAADHTDTQGHHARKGDLGCCKTNAAHSETLSGCYDVKRQGGSSEIESQGRRGLRGDTETGNLSTERELLLHSCIAPPTPPPPPPPPPLRKNPLPESSTSLLFLLSQHRLPTGGPSSPPARRGFGGPGRRGGWAEAPAEAPAEGPAPRRRSRESAGRAGRAARAAQAPARPLCENKEASFCAFFLSLKLSGAC